MNRGFLMARGRILLVASAVLVTALWLSIQLLSDNFAYSLPVRLIPALLVVSMGLYFFVSYRIMAMESDLLRVEVQNQFLEQRLGTLNPLERHDAITGLPTFVVAKDRLDAAIRRAQRSKQLLAIYRVQVDALNDGTRLPETVAQARVIKQKAGRMRRMLRGTDSIIHIGNQDFLVIVEALQKLEDIVVVNQKLAVALEMPVLLHDAQALAVQDKSALAVFPLDGDNARSLLAAAENHLKEGRRVPVHTSALLEHAGMFDWVGGQRWV